MATDPPDKTQDNTHIATETAKWSVRLTPAVVEIIQDGGGQVAIRFTGPIGSAIKVIEVAHDVNTAKDSKEATRTGIQGVMEATASIGVPLLAEGVAGGGVVAFALPALVGAAAAGTATLIYMAGERIYDTTAIYNEIDKSHPVDRDKFLHFYGATAMVLSNPDLNNELQHIINQENPELYSKMYWNTALHPGTSVPMEAALISDGKLTPAGLRYLLAEDNPLSHKLESRLKDIFIFSKKLHEDTKKYAEEENSNSVQPHGTDEDIAKAHRIQIELNIMDSAIKEMDTFDGKEGVVGQLRIEGKAARERAIAESQLEAADRKAAILVFNTSDKLSASTRTYLELGIEQQSSQLQQAGKLNLSDMGKYEYDLRAKIGALIKQGGPEAEKMLLDAQAKGNKIEVLAEGALADHYKETHVNASQAEIDAYVSKAAHDHSNPDMAMLRKTYSALALIEVKHPNDPPIAPKTYAIDKIYAIDLEYAAYQQREQQHAAEKGHQVAQLLDADGEVHKVLQTPPADSKSIAHALDQQPLPTLPVYIAQQLTRPETVKAIESNLQEAVKTLNRGIITDDQQKAIANQLKAATQDGQATVESLNQFLADSKKIKSLAGDLAQLLGQPGAADVATIKNTATNAILGTKPDGTHGNAAGGQFTLGIASMSLESQLKISISAIALANQKSNDARKLVQQMDTATASTAQSASASKLRNFAGAVLNYINGDTDYKRNHTTDANGVLFSVDVRSIKEKLPIQNEQLAKLNPSDLALRLQKAGFQVPDTKIAVANADPATMTGHDAPVPANTSGIQVASAVEIKH